MVVMSRPPRAPPPSSPARKRAGGSLWLSHSVRASVSLATRAARRCSRGAGHVFGIYFQERVNTRITPPLLLPLTSSFFSFLGLRKQPAVMSRAPEKVSKLTENTYKVSEV